MKQDHCMLRLRENLPEARKYKENYQKMFGKVMQICDQNVKNRLFRLPDFADVRARHDCIRLWEMICSVVGGDGTELDL